MRQSILLWSLALLSLLSFLGCQSHPVCGIEKRAAMDIGSGSTKLKVAEVNSCTNEILKILFEADLKVDYREDLEKSSSKSFSENIQQTGLENLSNLKTQALKQGADSIKAVATAAFRQAGNAQAFSQKIQKKLGIPVHIITQEEEALLGFCAVVSKQKIDPLQAVVWDIGGGSQQITALDDNRKPQVYFGQLASVNFKNRVIAEMQKKNISKVHSPNPMTKSQVHKAVTLAEQEAAITIPESLKSLMKDSEHRKVFGIGGVLTKSIARQVSSPGSISRDQIKKSLWERRRLTDAQIKDPYASTEITNLALVYGFMKGAQLLEYKPVKASLTDGLLQGCPEIFNQ